MAKFGYYIIWSICFLFSLLPFWLLYRLSDLLYLLIYHIVGYRKRLVRKNLKEAFPEKSEEERKQIEKEFYAFFCDYLIETVKLFSLSDKELKRRIQFEGVQQMVEAMEKEDKQFGFIYLGHYGNWEWISSLTARIHDVDLSLAGGQIYHPLRNKIFDNLLKHIRKRSGGINIPMKETLRYIVNWKREGRRVIIGFISDQAPKWNNIHHWTDFLHHKTPVFTGTERIGKQVDAMMFYADVERIRRGYYRCTISKLADNARQYADFAITDLYMQRMEQTISRQPAFWLWTHNRWKRTYEEFLRRQQATHTEETLPAAQPSPKRHSA